MQILGEFLETNCPDVTVKTIIKHLDDWDEFSDGLCRSYGFENKGGCPIIYTLEGKFIGSGRQFQEHVKEKYNKSLNVNKETQKQRDNLIKIECDEKMHKSKHGETLKEKIESNLEKVKKKKLTYLIEDDSYSLKFECGIPF